MNAPVSLDDVVVGELLWAASKATLSGAAILVVISALGLVQPAMALAVLPMVFLVGLAFAAIGLIVTALAPSYDFFMYYFTLFVTPMTLLSGVFFPLEQLPESFQGAARVLPLAHAVETIRPMLFGRPAEGMAWHAAALAVVTVVALWVAVALTRRRLLR